MNLICEVWFSTEKPRVMLHLDCQKTSRIGWVWQYMYKAFIARNNMHSLKIMYKALFKTLQKSPKLENGSWNFSFWLCRMTLLTRLAYNTLVMATEHLPTQYKNLKHLEDM